MRDFIQEYEGIYYAVNCKHIKIVPVWYGWYAFEDDIGDYKFKKYRKKDINRMIDVLIKRFSEEKNAE